MEFFSTLWLGMPVWIWFSFIAVVLAILAFDLGVMHRESHEIGVRESLNMSALYIGLGLAWAAVVWHGPRSPPPGGRCTDGSWRRCCKPQSHRRYNNSRR